jgi:hypothetical protein
MRLLLQWATGELQFDSIEPHQNVKSLRDSVFVGQSPSQILAPLCACKELLQHGAAQKLARLHSPPFARKRERNVGILSCYAALQDPNLPRLDHVLL